MLCCFVTFDIMHLVHAHADVNPRASRHVSVLNRPGQVPSITTRAASQDANYGGSASSNASQNQAPAGSHGTQLCSSGGSPAMRHAMVTSQAAAKTPSARKTLNGLPMFPSRQKSPNHTASTASQTHLLCELQHDGIQALTLQTIIIVEECWWCCLSANHQSFYIAKIQ